MSLWIRFCSVPIFFLPLGAIGQVDSLPSPEVRKITREIEANPDDWTLYEKRANLWLENDPSKALADIEFALKLSPDNLEILRQRAYCLLVMKDFDKSKTDFRRLTLINKKDVDAFHWYGFLEHLGGNNDAALKVATDAIKHNPQSDIAYASRAQLRSRVGEIAGAISDISKAIALAPKDSKHLIARTIYHLQNDDMASARHDALQVRTLSPMDEEVQQVIDFVELIELMEQLDRN